MKKVLFLIIAIATLISCASVKNGNDKATAEQKSLQIQDSIEARTLKVTFDYVTPMSMYRLTFTTRNDNAQLEYTLTIYPNGQAYLSVNSSDRESINFNGEMDL